MAYMIAEIGSNFDTLEHVLSGIEVMAMHGADAVKFQYYTHMCLYGTPKDKKKDRGTLDISWLPRIRQCCDLNEVDLIISAFSDYGVRHIDPYVDAHKIASCENLHKGILFEMIKTGKHVYISTGGTDEKQLRNLQKNFGPTFRPSIMYCQLAYPSKQTSLQKFDRLTRIFKDCPVGFSDHSKGRGEETWAIFGRIGERSLIDRSIPVEIHVNPLGILGKPDEPVSVTAKHFKKCSDACNSELTAAMSSYEISKEEKKWVKGHKRLPNKNGVVKYRPIGVSDGG